MSPYGGPALQLVVRMRSTSFCEDQWFAEHGFAVLVVDGRGTPGRGPAWEKTVYGDTLSAPVEDQADALKAVAEQFPDLDLSKVGIRGWSFGGALAAMAVIRRPEVSTPRSPAPRRTTSGCTTRTGASGSSASRTRTRPPTTAPPP